MAHPRRIVPLLPADLEPTLAAPSGNVEYHGGSVLRAVQVVPIYWGAFWSSGPGAQLAARLDDFFDVILVSSFMDLLAEYNTPAMTIGSGSRLPSVHVSATEPGTVRGGVRQIIDGQIQQALQGWLADGTIPPTTPNTLYFIYLPPNVVSVDGGAQSCSDYCGYHNHINQTIFYALVPYLDCPGCSFGVVLDSLTKVSSHELAEAVTDPALDGWWDTSSGEEIGDICNSATAHLGGFLVQPQWSNAQAACVVGPPSGPSLAAAASAAPRTSVTAS
jgi:hypothetical protein